ncbi:MAG: hypothetical protein ACK46X_20735 [Candidatus Sericytochromatia bacterium]
MHGKFDTSYRENRPYTSQQYAFASADGQPNKVGRGLRPAYELVNP